MASRCTHESARAEPAPAALQPKGSLVRRSKAGRWRALALVAVHALIALHVAHWTSTGSTMTPLEPSEAMEFSKKSLVNAGFIFFALAIGSTLLLGRWFCGWACHVVALQDACRWLLVKAGIRPRMVNLGILGAVPWLAFAYMFLAPLVQRAIHGDDLGVRGVELLTSDFWKTFPNWPTAVLTFLVCGFAIVYFLGSKGFCNYGCPYGAIFGVVDQLAPVRIRVTDACEGCGHCTAVCSSNVRVHQEVRDFGMVVDPGCMKCLDCVSVCPKDALYVGFGAPAIVARRRAGAPKPAAPALARAAELALLAAFFAGTYAVFLTFNSDLGRILEPGKLVAALSALSLAVALVFRGKSTRASEYTLAEQALLAGAFLLAMLAFRGVTLFQLGGQPVFVPFLFALGLSATLAYVSVQALRLLYRAQVSIQNLTLSSTRRLTGAGAAFAVALVPLGWVWTRAGMEQRRVVLAREAYDEGVRGAQADRIDDAIAAFSRAVELDPEFLPARENLAGMLCAAGRFRDGIVHYEVSLARNPRDADTHALLARARLGLGETTLARGHLETAVEIAPERADLRLALAEVCDALGDAAAAERQRAEARRLGPAPPH